MKTLSDGYDVSSRSYYFLLDWNEVNDWNYITQKFQKSRLCDLTINEYKELWKYATQIEHENL